MEYKPSTNIDPTKATLGEQSPAVLALQQAINLKNVGTGITPLAEDSKYGPQTQSYFQKYGYTPAPITSSGGKSPTELTSALDGKTPATTTETPTSVVGTSDTERAKIREAKIEEIKTQLESGAKQPELYKSSEEFKKLREEQGIVKDEEELASIRNEAALGKEELRQFKQTAGQGTTEGGRLGIISEAERNLNFRVEGLALREQAIVDRLNTKNAFIKTVLDLGKEDYQTAYTNYTNEYNKNVKANDLYNSELKDDEKDALSGLTTITNLMKDKNVNFSPALKSQIETLALKAGLPADLVSNIVSTKPDAEIAHFQKNDDGSTTVFYKQKGKIVGVETYGGGGKGGGTGGIANPEYAGIVNTILGSGKFTKDQTAQIKNAINNGEDPFTVIRNQGKALMTGANQTKIESYETAQSALDNLESTLKKYYEAGGSTNIFRGNYEKVVNKLGEVSNPKLVEIATQIQQNLQIYRNAVSGTAYSVQEGADIASIFPGITKSEGLNQAIINGRREAFKDGIDGAYRGTLGSAYDKLKALEPQKPQETSTPAMNDPQWMGEYNYDQDIKYAKEAIEAGANKEQIKKILEQKYLKVDL